MNSTCIQIAMSFFQFWRKHSYESSNNNYVTNTNALMQRSHRCMHTQTIGKTFQPRLLISQESNKHIFKFFFYVLIFFVLLSALFLLIAVCLIITMFPKYPFHHLDLLLVACVLAIQAVILYVIQWRFG